MLELLKWLFDGLGTMILGLVIGGAAGAVTTWRITSRNKKLTQMQRAGNVAIQSQVGGSVKHSE